MGYLIVKLRMCLFFAGIIIFLNDCLRKLYIYTRFNIEKDTWPPQQSKHFTTLAFIYHKNERTQKEVITIAKSSQSGNIDDIIQVFSHQTSDAVMEDFSLEGSNATKDISDLLAPLDCSDGSNQPQTVLIEGAPGIGKSFLLKHIAFLWATKHVLKSSKLLFLLCLRERAVQNMSSVNDLVNYFCKQEKSAENLGQICAAHLYKTGGKNVTILLDGLDEFPEDLQYESFIANLLEHRALPASNIIISSRPHASVHLHGNVMLRVDILGFTEEERESFIKESLKDKPDSAKRLITFLQDHPTISSLCFVPFIMTVLLFLYRHKVVPFDSSSELYKQFVCLTIRRHLSKSKVCPNEGISDLNNLPEYCRSIISDLSKLSLKALSENQLIFTSDEIRRACPEIDNEPGKINAFGLLQAVGHLSATNTTTSFNFIHFSIQEFLAAHSVANLPPQEEIKILKKHFWTKFHYNMFSMYIGLTKGQRDSFKQFLADGSTQHLIADKFLTEQKKCVYLYKCFYEAGDSKMCKYISEAAVFCGKAINLRGIPLLPSDVSNLGLFLAKSHIKEWRKLDLLSCNIRDVGCRMLHRALVAHNESVTIEDIHLSSNSLTSVSADYISEIAISCKVTLLYLNGNVLGKTDGLAKMLIDTAIEELYMHGNKLHTSTAISLFKALRTSTNAKLKILSLMYNDIHDEAGNEIGETLRVNRSLECLWINANPLSGKASLSIMDYLKVNNTLKLLKLPNYSYNLRKDITRKANSINKNRISQGCYVDLCVDFQ